MKFLHLRIMIAVLIATGAYPGLSHAADNLQNKVKSTVDRAITPIMKKYNVPGMAVGMVIGQQAYVFNYGVASLETQQAVTDGTLFEVGSISKTLTATLASYAQVNGKLNLLDKTSKYLPFLQGSKFGEVRLVNLGTHTSGGLPLQVPEDIKDNNQLMKYFAAWQPTYPPGTYRTYANPSIGMLGLITAKSMNQDFTVLMEQHLLPALGMKSTYINVPPDQIANYAQGYSPQSAPIRMTKGVLSDEAYGIKTTANDMIHFMRANMNLAELDAPLQNAVTQTHTGYFKLGEMTQDLIWEQYAYPASLETLLAGNSPTVAYKPLPVTEIKPPQAPRTDVLINKTGSTNGSSEPILRLFPQNK